MSVRVESDGRETVKELTVNDRVDAAISAELQPDQTDVRQVCDHDEITRHYHTRLHYTDYKVKVKVKNTFLKRHKTKLG